MWRTVGIAWPSLTRRFRLAHDLVGFDAAQQGRVEQAKLLQSCERCTISVKPVALAKHWLLPANPEPGEVLEDRFLELPASAHLVYVLDAEE
jgi:hypothetical protein